MKAWVFFACATLAVIASLPASAEPCTGALGAVRARTGMRVQQRPDGYAVLTGGGVDEMTLSCGLSSGQLEMVSASSRNAMSPESYFDTLAAAGSMITSDPAARLKQQVKRCYDTVWLSQKDTYAIRTGVAYIECSIDTQDGWPLTIGIMRSEGTPSPLSKAPTPKPGPPDTHFFPSRPPGVHVATMEGVLKEYGIGNASGAVTLDIPGRGEVTFYTGAKLTIDGREVACDQPPMPGEQPRALCTDWPPDIRVGESVMRVTYWRGIRRTTELDHVLITDQLASRPKP